MIAKFSEDEFLPLVGFFPTPFPNFLLENYKVKSIFQHKGIHLAGKKIHNFSIRSIEFSSATISKFG